MSVYGTNRNIPEASLVFLGNSFPTSLHPKIRLNVHFRQYVAATKFRPQIAVYTSIGILTYYPLVSPFGYTLGSTNPDPISVDQETLVYWRTGFSPVLSLLMPTFSLPIAP